MRFAALALFFLSAAAVQEEFEYKSYKLMLTVSGANCGGG